jgi:hypothetical protein
MVLLDARRNPATVYENTDVALARQYMLATQAAAGQGVVDVSAEVAKAAAWAQSPTAPDPLDATSKSGKTWAGEAAASAAGVFAPNIWTDPFFEDVPFRPYLNQSLLAQTGTNLTYNLASATSPFAKPFYGYTSGGNFQTTRFLTDLGLAVGDTISVKVRANFGAGSGQVTVYCRDAAGAAVSTSVTSLNGAQTGDRVVEVNNIVIPPNAVRIEIRVNQGGAVNVFAVAVGNGTTKPAFTYPPAAAARQRRMINQRNMWPDPFFRQWQAGVKYQSGGWGFAQLAGLANPPFITTSATAPTHDQNVIRFPSGSGQVDMHVYVGNLGLKAGDKLTVSLGVYAAQTVPVAVFGRTAAGAVVGSSSNTSYTFLSALSREITQTIDVDATFAATVEYLVIRFMNGATVGATPVDVWGRGLFVNDTSPLLYDDNYAWDMLAIERHRNPTFGVNRMRETHKRLMERRLGAASQLVVALIGDSFFHLRTRIVQPWATYMKGQYGDAGIGFIGFANPDTGQGNINGQGWGGISITVVGTWTSAYATGFGPDIGQVTATGSANQYRINSIPAGVSVVRLMAQPVAGSSIDYSTDAGATWTTVDTSTGTDINLTNLTIPGTLFNLWIRPNAGSPILYGLDVQSTASGVRVHKLGATGSSAQQWQAALADPRCQAALVALNPRCVVIQLATNDQTGSPLPVTFLPRHKAIITTIQTILPYADILVLMPQDNHRANNVPMASYAAGVRDICLTLGTTFHDLQNDYGVNPGDYEDTSGRPWTKSDKVHPNEDPAINGGFPTVNALRRIFEA